MSKENISTMKADDHGVTYDNKWPLGKTIKMRLCLNCKEKWSCTIKPRLLGEMKI